MPYTPPTYRQITLAVPSAGLPGCVFFAGSDAPIWQRSEVGGYASAGKTRQLATRLNRDAGPPWFVWAGSLLALESTVYLLERLDALFQNNPTIQFTLRDEFSAVDTTKGAWHSRALIPDSAVTDVATGLSRGFYTFNVLLSQRPTTTYRGSGYYEVGLSLEELT